MPGGREVRVAILAPTFPPAFRGGGPARTLEALVAAAPQGYDVSILCPDRDLGSDQRLDVGRNRWDERAGSSVFYASVDRPVQLARLYGELRRLRPEVVYLNSIFNLKLSIVPLLLCALRVVGARRVLIAPRGELDPGALEIRGRKKRLMLGAYRLLRLHKMVTWHASTPIELAHIEGIFGPAIESVVRENETSLPEEPSTPGPSSSALRAVFVSRLAPKKGLAKALEALRSVPHEVAFDVYGPEEDTAYVAECRDLLRSIPPWIDVSFHGAVPPEGVRDVFAAHDLFIFPTAGENFGHVIAESLSASCPVMTTSATPWTSVLALGGGVVVDPSTTERWNEEIARYAELDPSERLARRVAAGEAYTSWRHADSTPHVFELLLGPAPT